jgi:glucose/mannose transport system substrate-binding protein
LFYNKKLLAQAGVAEPGSGYTTSQLVADLGKVKGAGVAALCLGGKDAFASAELFENVLLSVVGADGWKQIASDQFDWSGSQAQSALGTFGQVLDNADPAAGGQTWDQATKKLASGQCAFESFNDSAYGELEADGAVEGTDFGVVPFPGTEKNYLAVVDAFVAGQGAKNGKNAMGFLTVVGSPTTTVAFNKAKGSVPLRSDVDMSSFPPYQRSAAESLRSGTILLSIVHGEAMTPSFTQGLYDAVSAYVKGRDARAFAQTLSDAVNSAAQVPAAH